jgi:hypothetical protein
MKVHDGRGVWSIFGSPGAPALESLRRWQRRAGALEALG